MNVALIEDTTVWTSVQQKWKNRWAITVLVWARGCEFAWSGKQRTERPSENCHSMIYRPATSWNKPRHSPWKSRALQSQTNKNKAFLMQLNQKMHDGKLSRTTFWYTAMLKHRKGSHIYCCSQPCFWTIKQNRPYCRLVYSRLLIDSRMSRRRHRCLKMLSANWAFSMWEYSLSNVKPPREMGLAK